MQIEVKGQPRTIDGAIIPRPFKSFAIDLTYTCAEGVRRALYSDTPVSVMLDSADRPTLELVTLHQLDCARVAYHQGLKSVQEVSADRFDEMLNILPPSRWTRQGSREAFHMCEHLAGPMVSWFVRLGGRFFEVVDEFCADHEHVFEQAHAFMTSQRASVEG